MLFHSGDELVEELALVVDVRVINNLGYEVLLVVMSAHVCVGISFIENLLRWFLWLWLFFFRFRQKIALDSGTLFNHDRFGLLDLRHSLNGYGTCLGGRLG